MSADGTSICHGCGKAGDNLKTCAACMSVKYCNAKCKKAHRKKHKDECQRLFDEALFKQPPPREDCPICFVPLPHEGEIHFLTCCGKIVCKGCVYAHTAASLESCPFCRASLVISNEEMAANCRKRMAAGDAQAFLILGCDYMLGQFGLEQDYKKALGLFERAVELGSTDAHYFIGCLYDNEKFITRNMKKSLSHWEKAAMAGHEVARLNLGRYEYNVAENYDRAVRHFIIAAKSGYKDALDQVKDAFRMGVATKTQFEEALRGYQASEAHSPQRAKLPEYA